MNEDKGKGKETRTGRAARLVEITPARHGVRVRLAYAGADNFTGAALYRTDARPFLHRHAALCLGRAARAAGRHNVTLTILDAFRPREAQWLLWRHTPNPTYVADPVKGSPHGRAVAVDLTLADAEGRELDMGTPFDDFTKRAHHGAAGLTTQAEAHRYLLLAIMVSTGWQSYRHEWWHYQLPDAASYPLLGDGDAARPFMA